MGRPSWPVSGAASRPRSAIPGTISNGGVVPANCASIVACVSRSGSLTVRATVSGVNRVLLTGAVPPSLADSAVTARAFSSSCSAAVAIA